MPCSTMKTSTPASWLIFKQGVMRKVYSIIIVLMAALTVSAQEEQKFSPEKFDAELQKFITEEAKLSTQEVVKFFPVYHEMQSKQRALFERQRNLGNLMPQDEASCLKAVRERDETELEMKRIQKTYHERFLEFLPASKVYSILKAEDKFHRHMFRKFNRNRQPKQGNEPHPGNGQRPPQMPRNQK